MINVNGYFSSPIRGAAGDAATQEIMDKNIIIGKEIGLRLRDLFGNVLNLYIPHLQDEVIQILWRGKIISSKNILEADCDIVRQSDILFVYTKLGTSPGMQDEIDAATKSRKHIVYFERFDNRLLVEVLDLLTILVHEKVKNFVEK
jgi:hypothetical protein